MGRQLNKKLALRISISDLRVLRGVSRPRQLVPKPGRPQWKTLISMSCGTRGTQARYNLLQTFLLERHMKSEQ